MVGRFAAILLLLTPAVPAQGPTTEDVLRQRFERKLAQPFVRHVCWETSLDSARARAAKEKKPILAYFTRSYEDCGYCLELEEGPLVSSWWKELSREVVPYLDVTTLLPGSHDRELYRRVGAERFPWGVLLDAQGRVLTPCRPESELRVRTRLLQIALPPPGPDEKPAAVAARRLLAALAGDEEAELAQLDSLAATKGLASGVAALYRRYREDRVNNDEIRAILARGRTTLGSGRPRVVVLDEINEALYRLFKRGHRVRGYHPQLELDLGVYAARGALDARDGPTAKEALGYLTDAISHRVASVDRARYERRIGYDEMRRKVEWYERER